MDIWPKLNLTCAKFSLVVERPEEFMWFPEAVLRGALGYFWHAEGLRFVRLYDLFFGATEQAEFERIATPPVGALLNCNHCGENRFELNAILFGKCEAQVPLLLESLHILGHEGVGERYVRFFVDGLPSFKINEICNCVCDDPVDGRILPLSFSPEHGVCLDIVRPMTLRALGGKFLMEWDTGAFFRNLVQRLRLLSQFYGEPLPPDWGENVLEDVARVIASSDTRIVHRARRSTRQNARLDYSGFTGSVVLRRVSADLFGLLRMGRLVGVGKNTVMGSGRYLISML